MPYSDISELPEEQVQSYDDHQKEAFRKAFNDAIERYGDEQRAFATAHAAAKKAGRK